MRLPRVVRPVAKPARTPRPVHAAKPRGVELDLGTPPSDDDAMFERS